MSARANRPILIKRITVVSGGGHHGGAWKVAYADFVTAMMAFFLLMWLLNATTEKQRAGLADYFNPTVVQSKSGGETTFDQQSGGTPGEGESKTSEAGFERLARDVATALTGTGAESMQQRNLLRHVVTRVTDEGLVIELSDLLGEPLFEGDTSTPRPATVELAAILARVLGNVRNEVALTGHVHSFPETLIESPVWKLSDERAHAVRALMEGAGFAPARVQRVVAFGDRRPRDGNPMHPSNNRIELILLKKGAGADGS